MSRFLLVSLKIDPILDEVTISQRRRKLEEMEQGSGLSDAYTTSLARLKAQKGNKSVLGLKVLMWVLYSERPLRAEELCHALGVEIESIDLDPKNIPSLQTLRSSCLGLVTIEASSSTVRLVHFTLQEHLLSNPVLFHSPHATIAEVCLTFLNFGCIKDLSPTDYLDPSAMPLLEYASCYWGKHTRMGMTENVTILALRLLDGFDKHISAQLLLLDYNENRGWGPYFVRKRGPTGFTGLHGVSFLGIVEIAASVLKMREWDVNAMDCMGMTALTWAACRGYEEVANILLELKDVNPDQADTIYGQTPLSWAAEGGHEGVVEMFLEREDVNPDQADTKYGRTPLWWAAKKGHEGIVKMLLEREDVNPNQADTESGRTPLWWAAANENEGIVKMLLEREDVNPDQADTEYGRTPLSWAAEKGHEGIVKMLLEREDVNPNQADTEPGRTPLWWAAAYGHEGTVKVLLKRGDVNPDQADTEYGGTPLWLAAYKGHEGIVKILLEREDVNPNRVDTKSGRTPLAWAAKNGHGGVAKILLQRDGVLATTPDHKNETPLSFALAKRHHQVVKILQENANSHATEPDGQGSLPQSTGHEDGCAADLQSRSHDPDANITGRNTQPAPLLALSNKREAVLDLKHPFPKPTDGDLSSTEQFMLPQPHSISSPKLLYPPRRIDALPNSTRSALPFALNQYFLLPFFICLLAFLIYAPLPPLPHISFYK